MSVRPPVFRLVYVELATADLDGALAYYAGIMGGRIVARDSRTAYVSLGADHHNIALSHDGEPGLRTIGLQADPDAFDDLDSRLREIGITADACTDSRPGVPRLLRTEPIGGHIFEIAADMAMPAPGFASFGIVPHRLGHAAILTPQPDAVVAFLVDGLGFAVTDWFEDAVTFLTCNRDHHVMNVVAAPMTKLHHLAFELRSSAHQFSALDLLAANGRPTVWGPSRHTAGHNLASYHRGPDDVLIELYADMDVHIPELGFFEPRPWHDTLPQRPRKWPLSAMTTWGTRYEFDFRTA